MERECSTGSTPIKGVTMLAYIDAGTAAAIAAMATGGLAGAKVAAQSFFTSMKKKNSAPETVESHEPVEQTAEPVTAS